MMQMSQRANASHHTSARTGNQQQTGQNGSGIGPPNASWRFACHAMYPPHTWCFGVFSGNLGSSSDSSGLYKAIDLSSYTFVERTLRARGYAPTYLLAGGVGLVRTCSKGFSLDSHIMATYLGMRFSQDSLRRSRREWHTRTHNT